MNAPSNPKRFPKIESPFSRHENEDGEYVVYDEWNVDERLFSLFYSRVHGVGLDESSVSNGTRHGHNE